MHASSASRENRACGEDATICTYCEDGSVSLKTGKYTLRHARLDNSKALEFKRKGRACRKRQSLSPPPGQSAVSSKEKIALRER